jgi:hypothetical protein
MGFEVGKIDLNNLVKIFLRIFINFRVTVEVFADPIGEQRYL